MRNRILVVGMVGLVAGLSGCAGGEDYVRYLEAQERIAAAREQKPLLVLEAQPGQQITGLKRLEINAPPGVGQGVAALAPPPRSEWAGVVSQGLGIVGAVGGVIAGGRAAEGLARAVGSAATAGYSHVQAPGAVSTSTTTQTLSGTGALGGDYTHTPTATTTTTTTDAVTVVPPVTVVPVVTSGTP